MLKSITSKDNKIIKFACSLKEKKYQKENNAFLDETKKNLDMALSMNLVKDVFTLEYLNLPEEINQYLVSEEILKKLSYSVTPEVVFVANFPKFNLYKLDRVIYLDHISDPGNLGTIIRTALAFSMDAVILSEKCASIYNYKTIMSSKGAIYKIPVILQDINSFVKTHQIIVSFLSEKAIDYRFLKVKEKFVLVVGNESHGVKKELLDIASDVVKIPMDNIDSLNVSVAAGILIARYKN